MTMQPMGKSYDHLETEKNWYQIWSDNDLFEADSSSSAPQYSIILPPPNVTGSLHMGHALTFTLPDIIIRRKKMMGFNTLWLPGVDHAGIATQMMVEKHLKETQGLSKEDLGREKFLDLVWKWKNDSQGRIIEQVNKLGLSLDWSRMKFTLSEEMQEVVIGVFVRLYDEGKIYRDTYMVNHCPSCKTVLSDLEVNHKEISGSLTTIKYPLKDDPERFITVATTRPETMLGDVAVAVNNRDPRYKDLVGREVMLPLAERPIRIIADETVDSSFGTGAVKITPAHDPNDFKIALKHKLDQIDVIDKQGKMSGAIPEKFIGLDRFECRKMVLADLKEKGLIEKIEAHSHNVGHCQRCETILEPHISRQWFLKTKEIAQPAIEAVEKKRITLIPDKWKKVYNNWMFNIQDWCISRQLWWGHRIPAYYCDDCQALMVKKTPPQTCSECGSSSISQDPDVLDTWFSSALWPFSTLGWYKQSKDFQTFYPTSLMVTAFDIIFFWVARMIMMGTHVAGDIPFREVLLNGLIRDEKGQKMSKTKNNAIDPIDVIESYGSDALRFTLAIQAVPGMDITLSTNRVKGYKAFANKIWNASRYIIMNLDGQEGMDFDRDKLTETDKWILHSLNIMVDKYNELMDVFRIHETADALYHFFWHEYCDWYLEFSKNDADNPNTGKVLKYTLYRLLQLLHPFMPFISEEIYQKIKLDKDFLLQTEFPQLDHQLAFPEAYKRVELLKRIIMETRKTRTENRIDPNQKIDVYLKTDSKAEKRVVSDNLRYFDFLTRSQKTEIFDDFSAKPKGFRGVILNWEILLPFASDSDRVLEIERLQKEMDKLEKLIGGHEAKLANRNFVDKAPETVVLNFKKNLQESIDKLQKIEKTIKDLS